jgi:uncharacterized membrane protein
LAVLSTPVERPAQRASIIAVMTATCIASNYLLIGVVNVKFMDLIVFVSGFAFGPTVGASVGVMTWLVYGTLNPYGFSLPILVATSLGESLYGIAGGIMGKRETETIERGLTVSIKFAITGFLLTFVYDLITNIVSGLSAGIPLNIALVTGIPFAIAHEFSNAAFFFLGALPLIIAIGRLTPQGEKDG